MLALVADAYDAGPGERLGRIGGRAAAAAEPGDAVLGGDELEIFSRRQPKPGESRDALGPDRDDFDAPPGKSIHPRAPERQSILGGEIRNLETQRSIGRELAHETADVESKTELSGATLSRKKARVVRVAIDERGVCLGDLRLRRWLGARYRYCRHRAVSRRHTGRLYVFELVVILRAVPEAGVAIVIAGTDG